MKIKAAIRGLLPDQIRRTLRDLETGFGVRHISGSRVVRLDDDQAAVTCLVKNGGFYIKAFLEHYFQMGFKHVVILDNGSSDDTVQIANSFPNVSVFTTQIDVSRHQSNLKRHIARRAVQNGWCLDVDIDEFFEYPYSDRVPLDGFLAYLNEKGFTAVVTQMLDMFSDRPLSHMLRTQQEDIKNVYRYFSLAAIDRIAYSRAELTCRFAKRNRLSSSEIEILFGGIRKTLYGLSCLLTKHSLFRRHESIDLFPHVHFVDNASLADVTCALLHYKMTSNAFDLAKQNESAFATNSKGYNDFIETLVNNRDAYLIDETSQVFRDANQLVELGFLHAGTDYNTFARSVNVRGKQRGMCETRQL